MPARNNSSAPRFSGDARDLRAYFEEVEIIMGDHGLDITDAALWKRYVLRYLDAEKQEEWRYLQGSGEGEPTTNAAGAAVPDILNIAIWRQNIINLYPGAEATERYTPVDLFTLTQKRASKEIRSRDEFAEYHRQYQKMARFMKSTSLLSEKELNVYYLTGITGNLRTLIDNRLSIKEPDRQVVRDPYPIKSIYEAGRYILDNQSDYNSAIGVVPMSTLQPVAATYAPTSTTATWGSAAPVVPVPVVQSVTIKQEDVQFMIQEAIKNLSLRPSQGNYQRNDYGAGRGRGGYGGRGGSQRLYDPRAQENQGQQAEDCHFCGGSGHYMRECMILQQYIREEKASRDERGMVALRNGSRIPSWTSGRTIRERIDHYLRDFAQFSGNNGGAHSQQQAQPNNFFDVQGAASTYSFVANQSGRIQEIVDEDDDEVAKELQQQVYSAAIGSPIRAIYEQALDNRRQKVRNGENKPQNNKNSSQKPKDQPKPTQPIKEATQKQQQQPQIAQNRQPEILRPQYEYRSPVEETITKTAVFDKLLDAPVTLSVREVLGTSGDHRKVLREAVSGRRAPTQPAAYQGEATHQAFFHQGPMPYPVRKCIDCDGITEELPVGQETSGLRVIYPIIDGRLVAESVLDSGSSIISIRHDIWEKLGSPMSTDGAISMESANGSVTNTLGIVRNLPFNIGGLVFYLQVQVVKEAPWEVLLGLPFYNLASCVAHHAVDGSCKIALTDPANGDQVVIPTQARRKCKNEPEVQGFS